MAKRIYEHEMFHGWLLLINHNSSIKSTNLRYLPVFCWIWMIFASTGGGKGQQQTSRCRFQKGKLVGYI